MVLQDWLSKINLKNRGEADTDDFISLEIEDCGYGAER
jgi:hypothetical protein